MSAFLMAEASEPFFVRSPEEAIERARSTSGQVLVWAAKCTEALKDRCRKTGVPLLQMEDGFLRSRGLGSAHTEPASLVMDRRGIYYDATGPSDLEHILQHEDLPDHLLPMAAELRRLIVEGGLSKYNVGQKVASPSLPAGREVVLVAGQVGDDASIRLATGPISTNLALLRQVRLENPDAYIVYKPHPDVEFGRRWGWVAPHIVLQHADVIASDLAPEMAIEQADRVCVMTSLLGFEALLRGKPVTCYGMPFYAGWGLTNDKMPMQRRTRRRSLEEVLAAAYLVYARYIDLKTLGPADAISLARSLIPADRHISRAQ